MITRMKIMTAATLVALTGSAVSAEVRDLDTRSGDVMQATTSTVAYGGGAVSVRYWIPVAVPNDSSALNNAVVQVVGGDILGAVTSFSSSGNPNVIWYFQTADQLDDEGTYTSNNVVLDEFPFSRSDTLGDMLPNGRIVFRANFAGTAQNNLETILGDVKSQMPAAFEPDEGDKMLVGPGIDSSGNAYLGVPGALAQANGNVWVGNTNFDAFSGDIPSGCNIWDYDGTAQDSQNPAYEYSQSGAESFANANGVPVDSGDGRQTQPAFARVNGFDYVIFGINDTTEGGSGRPAMMVFDVFQDGNGFTGAIPLVAAGNSRFIDHQATGGGSSPFENKHFDMNSDGQFVAVTESIASVPTYQLLLYTPTFDGGGRITGFGTPTVIADAGPGGTVNDTLGGPIMVDDGMGGLTAINAISGVGINDAGNVGFTATWDTGEVDDLGDPILESAAYFYDAATGTLHQVLREGDVVGNVTVGSQITMGLLPQEDSDSFYGPGLANNADVMAFNFRPADMDARGTIVIAIGHDGDADFDGDVDQSDLGELLSRYGATFGSPSYDPELDFNCDGQIGQPDLGILLANYGN